SIGLGGVGATERGHGGPFGGGWSRRRSTPRPFRLRRSAGVTPGVEVASARNARGPRATRSPMHLMTTAAPTVGLGTLDGFDTVTLAAGLLETAFVPRAGMVGVS